MAKPQNIKPFIKVEQFLFEADFNPIEILIIAHVISWQVQGKIFFESEVTLSKKFNVDRRTVRGYLKRLINLGILIRKSNKGRAYSYYISLPGLKTHINNYNRPAQSVHRTCSVSAQDLDSECTGACSVSAHYNNNYNNNKINITEEGEPFLGGSPSGTISDDDLQAFLDDLDI